MHIFFSLLNVVQSEKAGEKIKIESNKIYIQQFIRKFTVDVYNGFLLIVKTLLFNVDDRPELELELEIFFVHAVDDILSIFFLREADGGNTNFAMESTSVNFMWYESNIFFAMPDFLKTIIIMIIIMIVLIIIIIIILPFRHPGCLCCAFVNQGRS